MVRMDPGFRWGGAAVLVVFRATGLKSKCSASMMRECVLL